MARHLSEAQKAKMQAGRRRWLRENGFKSHNKPSHKGKGHGHHHKHHGAPVHAPVHTLRKHDAQEIGAVLNGFFDEMKGAGMPASSHVTPHIHEVELGRQLAKRIASAMVHKHVDPMTFAMKLTEVEVMTRQLSGNAPVTMIPFVPAAQGQPITVDGLGSIITSDGQRHQVNGLHSPIRGPAVIVGKFGEMRKVGRHSGIDIAVPQGTPVYAVDRMVILDVSEDSRLYGKYIKAGLSKHDFNSVGAELFAGASQIGSNSGLEVVYGHLGSIEVTSGQVVDKGQIIGRSGSTGEDCADTGCIPQLHFEVLQYEDNLLGSSENPVDPLGFIAEELITHALPVLHASILDLALQLRVVDTASGPVAVSGNTIVSPATVVPDFAQQAIKEAHSLGQGPSFLDQLGQMGTSVIQGVGSVGDQLFTTVANPQSWVAASRGLQGIGLAATGTSQTIAEVLGMAPPRQQRAGAKKNSGQVAQGESVKTLQKGLNAALHTTIVTVDGSYGPQTTAAVKAFQTKVGLPATGVADADTLARLSTTLQSQAKQAAAPKTPPADKSLWDSFSDMVS